MAAQERDIELNIGHNRGTAKIGGINIEVSRSSDVVVYTDSAVQARPGNGSGAANEDTQISIGKDFNSVALYGAKIELGADGSVIVSTSGTVKVKPPAANDAAQSRNEPEPGDLMPDGTIFAGISPDTGKPMFTTPADAPLTYTFNKARKYAAELDAHSRNDWRVPTKGELNMLWENRDKGALKGTFNVTGSFPTGWYWSATENFYNAWDQRFSDGLQDWNGKNYDSSLRCVR